MGIDAIYYVKTKDGLKPKDPIDLPENADPVWRSSIRPVYHLFYEDSSFGYSRPPKENQPDPDFQIWTGDRYFRHSERYYRFWPQIKRTLEKLTKEHVAVWYSSDYDDFPTHEDLVTAEFIKNMDSFYYKCSAGKCDD